jgi:hypothetical protein
MIAASSSVIPSSRRHPDRRRRTLPPQWRACPERGGAESNAPPAFRFCLFFAVVRVPHPSRPCLMRWVGCTPPIHRRKGTRIGVPGERSLLVGVILRVPNRPSLYVFASSIAPAIEDAKISCFCLPEGAGGFSPLNNPRRIKGLQPRAFAFALTDPCSLIPDPCFLVKPLDAPKSH